MKITFDQKSIADAIAVAARFINARSPLPVLQTIRLEACAEAQTLTLTATDLDTGVRMTTTAAHVEESGAVCVGGQLLRDVSGKLPKGEARLETLGEGRCVLFSGGSRYELSTLSAEDYPALPAAVPEQSVTMGQGVLKAMLGQATVAAAKVSEEARAVMTGVLLSLNLDRLTMVSTDGRRLGVVEEVVEIVGDSADLSAVVPARALEALGKVLGSSGTVTVSTGKSLAHFTLPGYEFHCRLLEGRFPDHTKFVPKSFTRCARLDTADLLAAVKRLLPLAQEKRSPHLLRLRFNDDGLTITANTPDLGSGEERVACEYEGEPLLIGFNGQYLADGLAVLPADGECQIDLQEDTKSAVLRVQGQGFEYVLMPVKLRAVEEAYEAAQAA